MSETSRNRIVHGLGALVAGGAERAAVDLMLAMKAAGHDVELLCMTPREDAVGSYWRSILTDAGIPIATGPTARLTPITALWLASRLRRRDIALFHVHLNYVERAYIWSRRLHVRRYGVLRKLHNMVLPDTGWQRSLFNRSDIRMSVANGRAVDEAFRGKLPGEQVRIDNGVYFHWPVYDPAPAARRPLLEAIGLHPTKRHAVNVASMNGEDPATAQKAHDILIAAWKQSGVGRRGAVLHLLGAGTLEPRLRELAGEDESIVFEGAVPGVERWHRACDVFVLPSRWEGLPNAAIEAAGTGTPCIFSEIAPCMELCDNSAKTFPVDDVNALSALLADMLSQDPAAPNPDAVEAIQERYGIEHALAAYERVYERVLSEQRRGDS